MPIGWPHDGRSGGHFAGGAGSGDSAQATLCAAASALRSLPAQRQQELGIKTLPAGTPEQATRCPAAEAGPILILLSGLRTESPDIADPRLWFGDDLDEPLAQNAWMSFGFNPPRESVPDEPDQTNPGPTPTADGSELGVPEFQAGPEATAPAEERLIPEAVPAIVDPAQDPAGELFNPESPEPGPASRLAPEMPGRGRKARARSGKSRPAWRPFP